MATYLVTQATGQQSQWTITHLLEAGASVHAVVRDPQKIPLVLERPGVTVFQGQTEDFEAISRAAQGCIGVFLNTFPIPGLETQQARNVVDACKKAGVKTIVASTTFCAGDKALWDDDATKECGLHGYYLSKTAVEDTVRAAGFEAYTILRPSVIHGDFLLPNVYVNYPSLPRSGKLEHACNDGVRMPYVDGSDIGKYAAAALQDPAKFGGEEIDLGSENQTFQEAGDIIAKVSGRDVPVKKLTPEEIEEAKATVFSQAFQRWANVKDFSDYATRAKEVPAKFGIPFTPLESALERDKDRLLECLLAST